MKDLENKYRHGFSLIELMVVIVIVIILALALTPLFKEEIEKARYSEGISALGALNTKIKVYIAENNALPPASASVNNTRNVVRLVNSNADAHGFSNDGTDDTQNTTGKSAFQLALGIGYTEYEGRYFKQDHYQYCLIADNLTTLGSYAYGLAVVGGLGSGGGDASKASVGTYYAMFVRQEAPGSIVTPAFVTATKAVYTPENVGPVRLADSSGSGFAGAVNSVSLPQLAATEEEIISDGWNL